MKPAIANSELAIMELLWENDCLTARQIREKLYPDAKKSQHGTVQKLLQRLEEKGYIVRDDSEFIQRFKARVLRLEYVGAQLESLTSKLTSGSIAPLITHLVEQRKISVTEIEQIQAILEAYKGEEESHE